VSFDPHEVLKALLEGDDARAEQVFDGHADAFASWCRDHRLGAICHRLGEPGGRLRARLHEQLVDAMADDLARRAWVGELLAAANEGGFEVFAFKGCGIAHDTRVYANSFERPLGDVDLLVRRDDLDAMVELATGRGFASDPDPRLVEFQRNVGYQLTVVHPRHGVLELHHRLYADILPSQEARFLARATTLPVYGSVARVFALPDLLLVACAHIFRSGLLWAWWVDVALLARAMSAADWDILVAELEIGGQQVFVDTALTLLEGLWGFEVPPAARAVRGRMSAGLTRMERAARDDFLRAAPADYRAAGLLLARRLSGRPFRARGRPWLVADAGTAEKLVGDPRARFSASLRLAGRALGQAVDAARLSALALREFVGFSVRSEQGSRRRRR
jgi:hypothetical protein